MLTYRDRPGSAGSTLNMAPDRSVALRRSASLSRVSLRRSVQLDGVHGGTGPARPSPRRAPQLMATSASRLHASSAQNPAGRVRVRRREGPW
jgi:hypothetical protein